MCQAIDDVNFLFFEKYLIEIFLKIEIDNF